MKIKLNHGIQIVFVCFLFVVGLNGFGQKVGLVLSGGEQKEWHILVLFVL